MKSLNRKVVHQSLVVILVLICGHVSRGQEFQIKQTDFKSLYNNHRFASPDTVPWAGTYWPYGENGLAWAFSTAGSPAAKWDMWTNQGQFTQDWEKENHSCASLPSEEKKGCESWWGHCNAWAAAGIKEPEPRKSVRAGQLTFSVGDQKGYLTEIWMDSGSLFAGDTDKSRETGSWINNESDASYSAFWDVTPRTLFMVMTNYVGVMKVGVVIDRFTGDQVWNQSVVGYRILPIREENLLAPEVEGGRKIYPVAMKMKIYWADDGVAPDHVSRPFQIQTTKDSTALENFGEDYEGRLLSFILYFNAPVVLDANGKVASAGRIVGDGFWEHQDVRQQRELAMDDTHPDFIWMPTRIMSGGGDANPFIKAKQVHALVAGQSTGAPSDGTAHENTRPKSLDIIVRSDWVKEAGGVSNLNKSLLSRILNRELGENKVTAESSRRRIEVRGNNVHAIISVSDETPIEKIEGILGR